MRMDHITIGVVIPVYNAEKWIDDSLTSVLSQTYPFYESFIINDGSDDESGVICDAYANKYSFMQVIHTENNGVSYARNLALAHISSDYVAFLDADDYLDASYCEQLTLVCEDCEPDIVLFNGKSLYDGIEKKSDKDYYDRHPDVIGSMTSGMNLFSAIYPSDYRASPCMALFKADYLDSIKLRFPEGIRYEDEYFTFFALTQAERAVFIDKTLYYRRYHPSSFMCGDYTDKRNQYKIICFDMIQSELSERLPFWKELNIIHRYINTNFEIVLREYRLAHQDDRNPNAEGFRRYINSYIVCVQELASKPHVNNIDLYIKTICNLLYVVGEIVSNDIYVDTQNLIFKHIYSFYLSFFKQFPFNESEASVGLFGGGKHTTHLLSTYNALFGDIKSKVIIIESSKQHDMLFGHPVIECKEIKEDLDVIIMSSFLYEQEMFDLVQSFDLNIPIKRIYESMSSSIFPDIDEYYYEFYKWVRLIEDEKNQL